MIKRTLFWALIFIVNAPLFSKAQTETQTHGIIINEKGKAVAGVSVQVLHTNRGTLTDATGRFSLSSRIGDTLSFTIVGYQKQSFIVSNVDKPLNIILKESENDALNDVVVIGYGTAKKQNITAAQSTYDAKNIEERPIDRIDQALIGQLPGVQVRQQSGMPGNGLSILIRGSGSLSAGTEPLYVIDGFPLDVVSQNSDGSFTNNPLNNLNPSDIESITVLKDAAAGAIYGSRAANGVVLITTKKGKAGKTQITLNSNTGISTVAKKLDLLSPEEWVQVASEIADSNWVKSKAGRTADQTYAQRLAILGSQKLQYLKDDRWAEPGHPGLDYIDWQDAIYRKALYQNYNLSASGGTDNVHYFIAGNYLNQNGTLINSNYQTYGLRANIEANAGKKIKFGLSINPTYSVNNLPSAEGKDNILMKMSQMTPVVEDTAGLLDGAFKNNTYTWASAKYVSPWAYLENTQNLTKTSRVLGSIYAQYNILPELYIKSSFNYDGTNTNNSTYISDQVVAGAQTSRVTQPGYYSSGSYSGGLKQTIVNENTLNYIKTFGGKHNVSIVAGEAYNKTHTETFSIKTAGGYANDIVTTLNNAIPNSSNVTTTGTTSASNNVLFSYYGRLQYDYTGKYLFSASFRRDASSRFGEDNRWGTYPSVSLGWRISQESFFKDNVSFINDLKLRASWGRAGNNNIGDYNSQSTFTNINYSFGGNAGAASPGVVSAGISNPNLKWETSNTYDVGFDLAAINSRINVTFDVYEKKSSNLLMNLPVLAGSGFTSALQNIGSVNAKGLELGVNTINIKAGKFTWTTNANIAFNGNKVTSLGPNQTKIEIPSAYSGSNPPYLLEVGKPMFTYYITKVVGILSQADIDNPKVAKLSGETVGDAKYFDKDNNAQINADDRVEDGHPSPNYTWGLTNTFSYAGFELSVQAYGQEGGKIISYLGRAIDFSGSTTANILGIWRDRWTPQNQNYHAPRGKLNSSYTVPYVTSDWVYSTDFWRIQNITLGYNLGQVIKTGFLKNAKAYVALENFFEHDKYYGGVNPEAQNTNNSGNTSYPLPGDYGAMPLSKTVTLGFNLTF